MRLAAVGLTILALLGCGPSKAIKPTTDDSKTDDATTDSDLDSDPTTETDAGDTELIIDTDLLGGGNNGVHGPPLNCHPYDPISYTGWERKYRMKVGGGGTGVETQTSQGRIAVPGNISAMQGDGYAYQIAVTQLGSDNYTATYWADCSGKGKAEATEFAYSYKVSNQTLNAGSGKGVKYLPDEFEFDQIFAPSWTVDSTYKLRVPTGYSGTNKLCPKYSDGTRTITATYTGMGFEDITVAQLGRVEAYHMNVILDQTQALAGQNPLLLFGCSFLGAGSGGGNPLAIFAAFFKAATGFTPSGTTDGGYITASIDRWYVRGVGLVKETSVDYENQGTLLYEKELTSCKGLPDCK